MNSIPKKTADELLKIAEALEQQAADVTQFVCDKCSHTTTLAKIAEARKVTASEVGDNVEASEITVNDKVTCPAPSCDGIMAYTATEASAPYYFDPDAEKTAAKPSKKEVEEEKKETPEEQAKEEKGEVLHEEPHTAAEKVDYDSIDRYIKG